MPRPDAARIQGENHDLPDPLSPRLESYPGRRLAGRALPRRAGGGVGSREAHAQCRDFKTDGMADDGVYGPWFQAMYKHYGRTDCHRTDNDIGSAEVIAADEAEKNNPQAVMADIGIAFGPVRRRARDHAEYVPEGSDFVRPSTSSRRWMDRQGRRCRRLDGQSRSPVAGAPILGRSSEAGIQGQVRSRARPVAAPAT